MSDSEQNAFAALAGAVQSRTAKGLIFGFAVLELVNFAVLPAVTNTINARMASAEAIVEQAKGATANVQQSSEASFLTEDAATKAAIAAQAERFRRAEVRKTAAESKLAEAENLWRAGSLRAKVIEERVKAFEACTKSKMAEMVATKDLNDRSDNPNSFSHINYRIMMDDAYRHQFWRKYCLPPEASQTNTDAVPSAANSPAVLPPQGNCVAIYNSWKGGAPRHAAFATSSKNCAWSQRQPSIARAREIAIHECGDADCKIFDAR